MKTLALALCFAKGVDDVFYPGEMEARSDVKLRRDGIELPEDTVTDLERIGVALGIAGLG